MALRLFLQCRVSSLSQMLHKSSLTSTTNTSVCLFASDVASKVTHNNKEESSNDAMRIQRLVNNTLEFVLRESLRPQSMINAGADITDELSAIGEEGGSNGVSGNAKQNTGLTRKQINHLIMASLAKQGIAEFIAQDKNLLRNAWETMSVYCYHVHDTSSARGRFIAQSQHNVINAIANRVVDSSIKSTDLVGKGNIEHTLSTETNAALPNTERNKGNEEEEDYDEEDMIYWLNWNDVMHDVAKSIPFEGVTESDFVQRIRLHCPLFTTCAFHSSEGVGAGETNNNKSSVESSSPSVNNVNSSITMKSNQLDLEGNNTLKAASVVPTCPLPFTPFIFSRKKSLAQWINRHFAHEFLITRSAVTHLPLYHSRINNNISCDFFSTITASTHSSTITPVDNSNKICNNNDKTNDETSNNDDKDNNNSSSSNKNKLKSQDHVQEELISALQFALRVIKGSEQAQVPEWTDLNELLLLLPTHLTRQVSSWTRAMQHPRIRSVFDTRPFVGLRCRPVHFRVMVIVDLVSETEHTSPLQATWVERCDFLASSHDNEHDTHKVKQLEQMADAKLLDYLSSSPVLHDLPTKTKFAVKVLCRHTNTNAHQTSSKGELTTEQTPLEKIVTEDENEKTANTLQDGRTTRKQNDQIHHEVRQNKNSQHNFAKPITSKNQNANSENSQIEAVVVNKFLEVEHVLGALVETIQSNNSSTRLMSKTKQKHKYNRIMYNKDDNSNNNSTALNIENNNSCREGEFDCLERIIVLTTQAKRLVVESVLAEHTHNYRAAVEVRTFDGKHEKVITHKEFDLEMDNNN